MYWHRLKKDTGKMELKISTLEPKTGRHTANNFLPVRHLTRPGWAAIKKH
jgi:hypothetical protein